MLFVSNGAQLIEKKIELARRRMFLFSDDVEPPTNKLSYTDLIDKINKSRSFCCDVIQGSDMRCVRGAGWAGNKLFYNYVPNVNVSNAYEANTAQVSTTASGIFLRYYSVGKESNYGTALTGTSSLLERSSQTARSQIPDAYDMVLPAFDGTPYTAGLYAMPDSSASVKSDESGTIYGGGGSGIGRWSRTYSQTMQNIYVNSFNVPTDYASVAVSGKSVPTVTQGTEFNLVAINTKYPRLFAAYTTQVYGSYYFSGGGWSYTTSYSSGFSNVAYTTAEGRNYGTGTHEDTEAYPIVWGMLPIAFEAGAPIYIVISKSTEDFVPASNILPNEIPLIQRNEYQALVLARKFRM